MDEPAPVTWTGPRDVVACPACGCEAGSRQLVCPRCSGLLQAPKLKELAAAAEQAERDDRWGAAAQDWRQAIALLPVSSKQHEQVAARLERARAKAPSEASTSARDKGVANSGIPKLLGGLGAAGLLLWKFKFVFAFVATKAKFLLLGLSKGGTLLSMMASLTLYWSIWGWQFAAGLIGSIYVHEMGHVAALARLGIKASAPMFIPGLGAVVRMHEYPASPREDAQVGLAGPVWGLGAALVCWAAYVATGNAMLGAIAKFGAWINIFNLLPVWQLDGARGFHSLTRQQRWMALGVIVATLLWSGEGLLVLVALAAAFQAWRGGANKPDWRAWVTYSALILSLSWLATLEIPIPGGE